MTTKLQLLKHMYTVYCLSRVNSTVNGYSFLWKLNLQQARGML